MRGNFRGLDSKTCRGYIFKDYNYVNNIIGLESTNSPDESIIISSVECLKLSVVKMSRIEQNPQMFAYHSLNLFHFNNPSKVWAFKWKDIVYRQNFKAIASLVY